MITIFSPKRKSIFITIIEILMNKIVQSKNEKNEDYLEVR
jgi:hypothetical protein